MKIGDGVSCAEGFGKNKQDRDSYGGRKPSESDVVLAAATEMTPPLLMRRCALAVSRSI